MVSDYSQRKVAFDNIKVNRIRNEVALFSLNGHVESLNLLIFITVMTYATI